MKKKFMFLILSFLLIISISFVSAEFWACFAKGEFIDYCNPKTPDRTCGSSFGCLYCMDSYNSVEGCYNQGNWLVCNTMPQECGNNGSTTIDSTPPNMTVNSPVNNSFYDSRAVLMDIDVNERSDIFYYDNIGGRGRWSRLCTTCTGYSRSLSFDEGLNDITIRAKDAIGNTAYENLVFYVDSQEPRIYGTEPDDDEYTNGMFSIYYTEAALQNTTLYYKVEGEEWQNVTKTDCPQGEKQTCYFDLGALNGQLSLDYYFGVSDSAQTIFSGQKTVFVDTIAPELNVISPHNPVVVYNTRKMMLDINVSELVLLEYKDYQDRRPRWKRLCKDCDKHYKIKSFKDGFHNVSFRATDYAGNNKTIDREFFVDSKSPRISRTDPRSGYATGDFSVEYREDNPDQTTLHYGNSDTGYNETDATNCYGDDRGKQICSVSVSLDEYNGQEIEYWFVVRDIANNTDQKGKSRLKVDTIFPIFEKLNITAEGRYAYFDIGVSEKVDLEYIDNGGRARTLCRNCDKYDNKKSFSRGNHTLWIQATDPAGNAVGESRSFEIDY